MLWWIFLLRMRCTCQWKRVETNVGRGLGYIPPDDGCLQLRSYIYCLRNLPCALDLIQSCSHKNVVYGYLFLARVFHFDFKGVLVVVINACFRSMRVCRFRSWKIQKKNSGHFRIDWWRGQQSCTTDNAVTKQDRQLWE